MARVAEQRVGWMEGWQAEAVSAVACAVEGAEAVACTVVAELVVGPLVEATEVEGIEAEAREAEALEDGKAEAEANAWSQGAVWAAAARVLGAGQGQRRTPKSGRRRRGRWELRRRWKLA